MFGSCGLPLARGTYRWLSLLPRSSSRWRVSRLWAKALANKGEGVHGLHFLFEGVVKELILTLDHCWMALGFGCCMRGQIPSHRI